MKKALNKFEDGPFTPMKTPTIEEIEKDLIYYARMLEYGKEWEKELISFFATQIQQAKKEERELMVKEIENQKKSNTIPKEMLNEYHKGYDQALNQLLESIKRT
jgi:hypothetical protein